MPGIIQSYDVAILTWLRSFHDPLAIWTAWVFATLAWKGTFFWLIAAGLWFKGYRLPAAQLAVALLIGTVEIGVLKGLVLRPRPDLYTSQTLNIPMPELLSTTHSFPSGHTTLAACTAYILSLTYGGWVTGLSWLFVAAVGVARVFQGMHWTTDVIGSVILGAVAGWLAVIICKHPTLTRFTSAKNRAAKTPAPKSPTRIS